MPSIAPDDPTLGLFQVIREDGTADPETDPFLPEETLLAMHRELLRIRLLDERMLMRQRQGRVGFYGPITGQEATPVATAFAIERRDWVFPALRESSIMLARGFPLTVWLAQVYGNRLDVCKGRHMGSHQSGRDVNQVAWSSVIGVQIPQAVGAAMAARIRGDDVISVGFMGDGATSEGDFHTAMTFAAAQRAPCVLICQNNHWSISVPTARQTASRTLAVKAHAYGVQGVRVDGNDVLALHTVIKQAADRARRGEGPTFIEAVTYRIGPHSSSDDPTRYRSDEEVEAWRRKDPLVRFERYLHNAELLDDDTREALGAELNEEILAAIAEVEPIAPPGRETMVEDVFARVPWHLRDQLDELQDAPLAPSH